MKKELTDKDIVWLLTEVNNRLIEENETASILISGGASMALFFSRDRATQDIDAVLLNGNKEKFRNLISDIGEDVGLDQDWLNDGVKGFINFNWPKQKSPFTFSNLTVYSVPPKQLLAMKLYSSRFQTEDQSDAIKLMKHLNIKSEAEAIKILEETFPETLLTPKMKYFTKEAFEEYSRCYKKKEREIEIEEEEEEWEV